MQKEAAIGLGITSQAVIQINNGEPLKILYFEEGSPFALYGQGIIAGKEDRKSVRAVFDFLINEYNYESNARFYPEKIYKDKDYILDNYPRNIMYSNMSNDSPEEKTRLLSKWKY